MQELVESELRELYLALDATYDPAPGIARVRARLAFTDNGTKAPPQLAQPTRHQRPGNGRSAPWRRRRRYRHVAAVWLLIAVAATGVAAAAISLSGGSSPPVRLPGGTGLCPLGYPYSAEADQKLFYPPNYPGRAVANAHITRCFASTQDARAAGYRIAPPPSGDTILGPLYLAPTPDAVRRTCRTAQRFTHAVIYCPSRLPAGWMTDTVGDPDCPTADCAAPLLSISGSFMDPGFSTPESSNGFGLGNASMWAASEWQLRHYPLPIGCGAASPNANAKLLSRTTFDRHPAAWYQCPAGGPLMLKWHIGRESYGITADGPASLRRRLIKYVAAHLVPERRRH